MPNIHTTLSTLFAAIADAIRAKTGGTENIVADNFPAAIAAIPSGGGAPAAPSDINFYDFNGKRLYSYALSDLPLAALPALPNHSADEVPLTAQGWTHTLAQINTRTKRLDVGATYIPTDGKTHLIIENQADLPVTIPLYISQTVSNGVTIGWGDGSTDETLAGEGYVDTTHTYTGKGRFDITLTVASGCVLGFGDEDSCVSVFGSCEDCPTKASVMLKEAYIGYGVETICYAAFCECYSLSIITLPNGLTSIGEYAFNNCYSLSIITLPNGLTSIGEYAFYSCKSIASVVLLEGFTSVGENAFTSCDSIASVVLPEGLTSIGESAFSFCGSIASVVLPEGLTSIGESAFKYCYGMALYDFTACTSVPTLANKNAFSGIADDCVMRIPSALYAAWSTATNWSTYASYMVAV